MAHGLAWSSAAKIASREMRSSRGKFLFVILSVAIGVAALTGVRGFSASFRFSLLDRARSIMAADIAARTNEQPTSEERKGLEEISASGVQRTAVTEMMSMAASPSAMNAGAGEPEGGRSCSLSVLWGDYTGAGDGAEDGAGA
jgi:putative ABC transport system permease protein